MGSIDFYKPCAPKQCATTISIIFLLPKWRTGYVHVNALRAVMEPGQYREGNIGHAQSQSKQETWKCTK